MIEMGTMKRPRSSCLRVYMGCAATLILVVGVAWWAFGRPQFRNYRGNVNSSGVAMEITYPADWSVSDRRFSDEAGGAEQSDGRIFLKRNPPTGPLAWVQEYFYRIPAADWNRSIIIVTAERLAAAPDIDADVRRLNHAMKQMTVKGGAYSVRKTTCPAGPLVDVQLQQPVGVSLSCLEILLTYPKAAPGESQYGVVVRCETMDDLKSRMHEVSLDVVSKLKLVKGK